MFHRSANRWAKQLGSKRGLIRLVDTATCDELHLKNLALQRLPVLGADASAHPASARSYERFNDEGPFPSP